MWLNANWEVAAETVTPGKRGVGLFLEVCSFTPAPPLWVNLLSFLMTLQHFDCCCHFFSAACFLHTSEAKWWVAFTNNLTGLTCAVSVKNFSVVCVPPRICKPELMKLWMPYPHFNTICNRMCNLSEAWLSVYLECKIFIWSFLEKIVCRVWCLKGFVQGVVLPPKWRELCSCFKLVLRESLGAVFLVLTCSTMTGMWQSQSLGFILKLHPRHVTAEKLEGYLHTELPE